jgi:SNF2 family DNA or RNA helicase
MTGTPAAQSPEDAYGLAKLVNPTKVPAFFGAWKAAVMQKMSMFKWMPKSNAKDLVFKVLQPAIRFTKQECLDLPDMMYELREVPLTSQQKKYYDKLKKQMLIEAAGEEISAVNAAAKLTKLLQISCGSVYSDEGNTVHFDVSSRMGELEAIIDECLHKVIVFAPFTHTIEMIEEFLTRKKHTCAVINGAVSLSKRSAIIEKFQNDPMLRVIIIQPQAAAHGITLTAADTVVWFGPTTSVETFIQANSRAHRKGQHNKVTVYMIQGSPAESKIYASLNKKIDEHEHLIALYNDIINS